MKKFLMFLFVCLLSITAYAQKEHLTFKGIPIDGKLTAFVNKLQDKGFKVNLSTSNFAQMEGEFSGKICEIYIQASLISNTTYQVHVLLEESDNWFEIRTTYNEYKKLLTSKYGAGNSKEDFMNPYYEGDGYEMTAIRKDKCRFFTMYELPNGKIALGIASIKDGSVLLIYSDKMNEELAEQEKVNQRKSDL
jgi:hypothetical protein